MQEKEIRLLVVDDESVIALDLKEMLTHMGYDVVGIASSGVEAVEKAEEFLPDLILMDIMMPGELDGIDASELIRYKFGIPVIFVTAYPEKQIVAKAKINQPYGYILKPFQGQALRATIEIALYKKEMETQVEQLLDYVVTGVNENTQVVISIIEQMIMETGDPKLKEDIMKVTPYLINNSNKLKQVYSIWDITKRPPPLQEKDVEKRLNVAIENARIQHPEKELEITIERSGDIPPINVDNFVDEVFLIPITNAMRRTKEDALKMNAHISFQSYEENGFVEVKLVDYTQVIKQDMEYFMNGNEHPTSMTGNVGLSFIQLAMQRYSGELKVEHCKPDQTERGCKITLRFPTKK